MKFKTSSSKFKNIFFKIALSGVIFSFIFLMGAPVIQAQQAGTTGGDEAMKTYNALSAAGKANFKFAPPTGVGAFVQDVGQIVQSFLQTVYDFFIKDLDKRLKSLGNIAYKNALRTFTSQLAYDTATRIVEGDWGKSPLINQTNWNNFLEGVASQTLTDTLDVVASTNGFLQFDICDPASVDFKFALNSALFDNFQEGKIRTKSRCSWQQIAANWDEWSQTTAQNLTSEEYLKTIQNAFTPDNSQTGMYLTISSKLSQQIEDKKTAAAFERLSNQNFKDITSPISGWIKTPASMSKTAADELAKTSVLSAPELVSTGDIVADSIGIFTNTLAAKAIKKWFTEGLVDVKQSRDIFAYNWALAQTPYSAEASFASLTAIQLSASGDKERLLEPLAQCGNVETPGPTDCVITSAMASAIEQRMTVQEAVNKNLFKGDGYFGFIAGGGEDITDYKIALPYRSLVILRQHRVIPATWEIAALYWQKFQANKQGVKQLTLKDLINCFEDVDDPSNNQKPDICFNSELGFNPYYHLVDPNWILKIPESICVKKGSGYRILTAIPSCLENNVKGTRWKGDNVSKAEITEPACDANLYENPDLLVYKIIRDTEYCADYKTCLNEDANGNCVSVGTEKNVNFGYCLKEEPLWRLPSKTCDGQFDTCESFKRTSDGQVFSYLRNTLQGCSSQDGGCWWYSTVKKEPRRVPVTDSEGKQIYKPLIGADGKQVIKDGKPVDSLELVYQWVNDWSDQDRIYLNDKVESCGSISAGCTKLSRMLPGTNLVFNGNFSQIETVAGKDKPFGWVGKCVTIDETFVNSKTLTLPNDCTVTTSGFIPIDFNFSYVLDVDLEGNGYVELMVNDSPLDNKKYFKSDFSQGKDVVVNFPTSIKQIKLKISAGGEYLLVNNVQLLINKSPIASHNKDNFVTATTTYAFDYSVNENYGRQYLKVAPSYLKCSGYNQVLNNYTLNEQERCTSDGHFWRTDLRRCVWSGTNDCSSFATECKASEVGCQSFRPVDGGVAITGAPREADYCPSECVGYDSYLETPTRFDTYANGGIEPAGKMFNFIPTTARACSAIESGCEEFTNLDASTAGGESLEYFTDFRQCVPKDNSEITSYYTWEGSDIAGYQLKKWEFLRTNLPSAVGAPCVNLVLGSSQCKDTEENIKDESCSVSIFQAGTNPNCLEFFNVQGRKFYLAQDRPVVVSNSCRAYRKTTDNKIYNVDLALSRRCSASVNGCREYKGNQSNNQKTIFSDTFEDGTIGGWTRINSIDYNAQSTLEYSTEALNQGGHSLKLLGWSGANHLYRQIKIISNQTKEYRLSFWAKKINASTTGGNNQGTLGTGTNSSNTNINAGDNNATGNNQSSFNFIPKAQAQVSSNLVLDFDTAKLNGEWQLFTTNKVSFGNNTSEDAILQLTLANANSSEIYYFDNIVLTASADIFYVIKDSWQTDPKCDDPFVGAQLGCRRYKDTGNNNYYLKSLNSLCSASAIGCEAYLNTQNSTYSQGLSTQQSGICSVANGGIIKGAVDWEKCYINNKLVCALNGKGLSGNKLKYDGSVLDLNDKNTACSYMTSWTVANDELIYLVNDSSKACSAAVQGCSLVGKPAFDRTLENYLNKTTGLDTVDFVKSYQDLYLINNPDKYNETACSESGLFCTGFNEGKYFYDPQGFKDANGADLSRTCYFKDNKWWETGSKPEKECSTITINKMSYLPTSSDSNYEGRAGICLASQSTCTGFRQPQAKSVTGAEKCDAQISQRLIGVCGDEIDLENKNNTEKMVDVLVAVNNNVTNNKYCEKKIDGVWHKVCKSLDGKACNYNAYQWVCVGGAGKGCKINDIKVCDVKIGDNTCSYSLVCPTDYYLKANLESRKDACASGKINPEGGCTLLFDSGLTDESAGFAADNTPKLKSAVTCNQDAIFGSKEYCNAHDYYGVTRDRQCAEWLKCGSAMVSTDSNGQKTELCQDLVKCDSSNNCAKNSITEFDVNNTVDLENLRYLSGFSFPNVKFSDQQKIIGRESPEQLQQVGENWELSNGDFEVAEGAIDQPADWFRGVFFRNDVVRGLDPYYDSKCQASLDKSISHSGRYSLALNAPADLKNNVCFYQSDSGTISSQGQIFFEIKLDDAYQKTAGDYILSFYARSSSGDQKFQAGLALYDKNYVICGGDKTDRAGADSWCNDGVRIKNDQGVFTQDGYTGALLKGIETAPDANNAWQKYTYVFKSTDFPKNARFAKVMIIMGSTYDNNAWETKQGSVWFDDFSIKSSLKINSVATQNSDYISKECRLYPNSQAPACDYNDVTIHRGWNGYCLDPDPKYQLNPLKPNDYSKCLQWYPTEILKGDNSDVFSANNDKDVTYLGPRPLYYCLQSSSGSNFKHLWKKAEFRHLEHDPDGRCEDKDPCYISKLNTEAGEDSVVAKSLNINQIARLSLNADSVNGEAWPEPVIDFADLKTRKCGDTWVAMQDSAGNPTDMFKLDCPRDNFGRKNLIFYPALMNANDDFNAVVNVENRDYGRNFLRFDFWFYDNGNIVDNFNFNPSDGTGFTDESVDYWISIELKEVCTYVAQVVDPQGRQQVYLESYNNNVGIGNTGYGKDLNEHPFGGDGGLLKVYGGFQQPAEPYVEPDRWSASQVPVSVYFGGFGGGFAGLPLSKEYPLNQNNPIINNTFTRDRVCIAGGAFSKFDSVGVACKTSADCDGFNAKDKGTGVCAGVGMLCYYDSKTYGQACSTPGKDSNGCNVVNGSTGNCRFPLNLIATDAGPAWDLQTALDKLQKLFVRVFKIWKWTDDKYVDCQGNCAAQNNNVQPTAMKIIKPTVNPNNFKVTNDKATLEFEAWANGNQLPIREMEINWGDGKNNVYEGVFGKGVKTFYHSYSCESDPYSNTCKKCNGSDEIVNGPCTYGITIRVKDNWGGIAEDNTLKVTVGSSE
jgi:hypothetical protein